MSFGTSTCFTVSTIAPVWELVTMVRVYVCMSTYLHIYIHTYINTYIHCFQAFAFVSTAIMERTALILPVRYNIHTYAEVYVQYVIHTPIS